MGAHSGMDRPSWVEEGGARASQRNPEDHAGGDGTNYPMGDRTISGARIQKTTAGRRKTRSTRGIHVGVWYGQREAKSGQLPCLHCSTTHGEAAKGRSTYVPAPTTPSPRGQLRIAELQQSPCTRVHASSGRERRRFQRASELQRSPIDLSPKAYTRATASV